MNKETIVMREIREYLETRGWLVLRTHGGAFIRGFPDLYAAREGMARWIEVKQGTRYKFTPSQLDVFSKLEKKGIGVWVLTSANDYSKLFGPANWRAFLRPSDFRPTEARRD